LAILGFKLWVYALSRLLRKTLYHLSNYSRPFYSGYFGRRVSLLS
jgi:hypothetical protein